MHFVVFVVLKILLHLFLQLAQTGFSLLRAQIRHSLHLVKKPLGSVRKNAESTFWALRPAPIIYLCSQFA